MIAYENDDSSETQATIQKLKVSLQEAKDNLEETEMERYLSDQEKMLDSLSDSAQEFVSERLDNIDGLLREAIDSANANASAIHDTLVEVAGEAGINLSDEISGAFDTDGADTVEDNVTDVLGEIKDLINSLVVEADGTTSNSSDSQNMEETEQASSTKMADNVSEIKDLLKILIEISKPIDKPSVELHGYATGARRIKNNELAWTQENGTELIYRSSDGAMLTPLGQGDAVFTSEMTQRLWEIAQNPGAFSYLTPTTPSIDYVGHGGSTEVSVEFGDINMYGVNNPTEFAQQLKSAINNDTSVRKILQDTTIGQAMGRNSLNRLGR